MKKLVHISETRCWRCLHLRRNLYASGYNCPRNKQLPDMLPAGFAEKCSYYCRAEGIRVKEASL
jgi:hypothetical protein